MAVSLSLKTLPELPPGVARPSYPRGDLSLPSSTVHPASACVARPIERHRDQGTDGIDCVGLEFDGIHDESWTQGGENGNRNSGMRRKHPTAH